MTKQIVFICEDCKDYNRVNKDNINNINYPKKYEFDSLTKAWEHLVNRMSHHIYAEVKEDANNQ